MHKKRFPAQMKSKLHLRGDEPFQILKRINYNANKIDLRHEYGFSTTFIVSNLTLFDASDDDSMSNPFLKREGMMRTNLTSSLIM